MAPGEPRTAEEGEDTGGQRQGRRRGVGAGGDGQADDGEGELDELPAQGAEVRRELGDAAAGFGQRILRDLDAGAADGTRAGEPAALAGAALGEALSSDGPLGLDAHTRKLEAFAPPTRRPWGDLHEA